MITAKDLHEHYTKQEKWGWGQSYPLNRRVIRDCEVDLTPHPAYGSDILDIYKAIERAKDLGCNYVYQETSDSGPHYPIYARVKMVRYRVESDAEYQKRLKDLAENSYQDSKRLIDSALENISLNTEFQLY